MPVTGVAGVAAAAASAVATPAEAGVDSPVGEGSAAAAAGDRTMEVMRADWQMLWACTTGW